MNLLRERKLKSGCSRFYFDAEEEEIDMLLLEGIRRFAKESKINVKVIPIDKTSEENLQNVKKLELSKKEQQYLLNIGFSSAICNYTGIDFPGLDVFDKM